MKKLTIEEVAEVIEHEGLGYTITDYMSPSRIKDPYLSALFEEARDILIRIQEYIDNNLGIDEEDDSEDEYDSDE